MIYFIIFVSGLILGFSLLSNKYANPYKNIFVFGKKGSGKSCLMVREIIKHQKKGWICYTDLPVNIPGVRRFNPEDLKKCTPEEHSFICIDEGGILFDNRNFKNFDSGWTFWFKMQRHYKCKVMINSQAFDVDLKIRNLTDSMILQSNIGNIISVSRPISRIVRVVEASADSESRIADDLKIGGLFSWKFYYMPKYFKYFDSFAKPEREIIPGKIIPCKYLQDFIIDLDKIVKPSIKLETAIWSVGVS